MIRVNNPGAKGASGAAGGASSDTVVDWKGEISPTQLTVNPTNNWAPTDNATSTVLRLSASADLDLTGLAGGAKGRFKVLRNMGPGAVRLRNQNVLSSSFNRFALGDDIVSRPNGPDVVLEYDLSTGGSAGRWRLFSAALQEGFSQPEFAIAAAATTDIGTSNNERVNFTGAGNPTITSLGTRPNCKRWIHFSLACIMAQGAGIKLADSVSRQIQPGSYMLVASDAAGVFSEYSFTDPAARAALTAATASAAASAATVAALPTLPLDDNLEPDGAREVHYSQLGLELERSAANGERFDQTASLAPVAYFDDDDGGRLKAIGGKYITPTTLLEPALANTIIRTSEHMRRVQGGWRTPFKLLGRVTTGRVGEGAIIFDNAGEINVFIFMGQSNHGGFTGNLMRTTHPYAQRLLIPKTANPPDIRLFLNQIASQAITSAEILGFTPLVGARTYPGDVTAGGTCQSEIAMSTLAQLMGEACGDYIPPLLGFTCWNGGNTVSSMFLGGGSNVNENVRATVAGLVREAAKIGYRINVRAIHIDQGEADTANATLAQDWLTIVDGINTYVKGITGQPNDIVPFINQTSSFSTAKGEYSKIDSYIAIQKPIPSAPRYGIGLAGWNPGDPYLHMLPEGQMDLGTTVGISLFNYFCKGGWTPLYLTDAYMTSGTNILRLAMPEAVEINTGLVEAIAQNGIHIFSEDSGSPTEFPVSGAVAAGNIVTCTLTGTIASGTFPSPIVTVAAYPGQTSPRTAGGICRSNICSVAEYGKRQDNGRSMRKWLLAQKRTIRYGT